MSARPFVPPDIKTSLHVRITSNLNGDPIADILNLHAIDCVHSPASLRRLGLAILQCAEDCETWHAHVTQYGAIPAWYELTTGETYYNNNTPNTPE